MTSRRGFLGRVAGAALFLPGEAGQGGLEQFGGGVVPCAADVSLTPAVAADGTYRPGAPLRASFIEPGVTGSRLTLTGVVAGISCGPIDGADIEFWQPDGRGAYDPRGFRLRGRQRTDTSGRYRLVTIVPGAPSGRAPHLGVRLRVAERAELWTELFFPRDPANRRDPRFRDELLMVVEETPEGRMARFDFRLNL
jgi:protocatechuate 3,4-dioxygenase beta subunit